MARLNAEKKDKLRNEMTTFQQLIGSLAELAVKAHGPTLKINKDDIFLTLKRTIDTMNAMIDEDQVVLLSLSTALEIRCKIHESILPQTNRPEH